MRIERLVATKERHRSLSAKEPYILGIFPQMSPRMQIERLVAAVCHGTRVNVSCHTYE